MSNYAKSIMIQGTGSSVGKSLITAGLCRILMQDGKKVAPFKSQNMALNSYITKDGGEMGRAQVVQAEAAGIEPHVDMNPILLKPSTDKKAQVIVKGKVFGNMSAMDYHTYKPELKKLIMESYDNLAKDNDVIVLEGAGSPAEINLRDSDVVNMGMAELSNSPVILVGDIDKGGVFASLAGTMLLLSDEEKARVKGVIINKFRGDIEILKPGLKMLEDIIKIPVLGVVPYTRLNIEEEDSVVDRMTNFASKGGDVVVSVIMLRHMSNFTDFNAFDTIDGVNLRYITKVEDIKNSDLVIIPGSKNTIDDMLYLRESGFENAIIKHYKNGGMVFGICGGYQMLGQKISDPLLTESSLENTYGIGLLDIETTMQAEKVTTLTTAIIHSDNETFQGIVNDTVEGYEIHMGNTSISENAIPFMVTSEKKDVIGVRSKDGKVFGTYLHGVFDNMTFTNHLINKIRVDKGLDVITTEHKSYKEIKDKEYDKLAEVLRQSLDMNAIYKIIEEGCSKE